MKKIIPAFAIMIMMISGLSGQHMMYGGPGGPMDKPGKPGKPVECISDQPYYQYMVFRMTEILKLTPEQAEKLFPLNRPYRDQKHSLHMQMEALGEQVFSNGEITKADLEKFKEEINRIQKEEAKLDEQFYSDVENFLDPEQVAKLIFFDSHFRRELSKELKERYNPEQKKGSKKFWKNRNK